MRLIKGRYEEAKTIWGCLMKNTFDPIHGVPPISEYTPFSGGKNCESLDSFLLRRLKYSRFFL